MMRSTPYMIREPMISPPTHTPTEEIWMLSGISCRNEMPSITPAAKQSILHIYIKEGFFNTPIIEPMIGPSTEMITIKTMGSMTALNLLV
jgi:hypothetical protein